MKYFMVIYVLLFKLSSDLNRKLSENDPARNILNNNWI